MARRRAEVWGAPVLSLDAVAWEEGVQRRPQDECARIVLKFIEEHESWIIEGCYGSLAEVVLPHCGELLFLNPGVETCVDNCRARPWEPEKFATRAEQDAILEALIEWVRQYDARDDEFGLARHRAIFESFVGEKREITSLPRLNAQD